MNLEKKNIKDKKVRDYKTEYKVELLWTVMQFVLVLLVLAFLCYRMNVLSPPTANLQSKVEMKLDSMLSP